MSTDFLEDRLQDQEMLAHLRDSMVTKRLKLAHDKRSSIRERIRTYERELNEIPAAPGYNRGWDQTRAWLRSAIKSLQDEYWEEDMKAWKDVRSLVIERETIRAEVKTRKNLFAFVRTDDQGGG
jgi:hypothetical protein